LGPFGIPVPNEITIVTGGILAGNGVLNPWTVYLLILAGLLVAATTGYWAGNLFARRIALRFGSSRALHKAEKLFGQYGNIVIGFGYAIPVVRYAVPVFAGISGVPFKKFAALSYTGALIWTSVFFAAGQMFGERIIRMLAAADLQSLGLVFAAIVLPGVLIGLRYKGRRFGCGA